MLWKVLTPFSRSTSSRWIVGYLPPERHRAEFILADYTHDRSRKRATARDWLDYLRHAVRAYLRAVMQRQPVGLITAFPQLPLIVGMLKRASRSQMPLVAWCFNMGRVYGGAKGRLARFALNAVDVFVVHSSREIEVYSAWLGIPRERFVFVPLSIDVRPPTLTEDDEHPFVLAMGTANRDYETFIAAVGRLGYRTVIVAGAHAVSGLRIPPNVSLRSDISIDECHELCQRARVNVIAVDNDTTASGQVALLETMMFGKAVVCTRCAGTIDYVQDRFTALLVPPKDVDAMIFAIETLWTHPEMRSALGTAARKYVESNITFEAASQKMISILDRMAGERRGSAGGH